MLKWVIVLLIAFGAFYVVQNWSSVSTQWNARFSEASSAQFGKEASLISLLNGESWGVRNVGGIRVELPFPMNPFTPPAGKALPPNVRVEFFSGKAGGHEVLIGHGVNTTMAGGLSMSMFSAAMDKAARSRGLELVSSNSGTTLLHGFRARRSDYYSQSSPRLHVRCVLLERGSEAWFLQALAPENDAAGESFFQRMASSAQ